MIPTLTRDMKRKSDKKKSIFDELSKVPMMESHARLAMLGAAKKRKRTGRSITGSELLPDNR